MLTRALESARSQRNEVHLVVVAPKQARDARDLAVSFGATVVDDPGLGMAAAINVGLAASAGETYYSWLGDDDSYVPGGLDRLVSLLNASPGAIVAFGACEYVNESRVVVWTSRAGPLARWVLGIGPNLIPHPAALIRMDALMSVGGYQEDLRFVMDLDLFLRLKKKGPFVSTNQVVSRFGWHVDSLTVRERKRSGEEARRVKRKHLPRWILPLEPLWEYPVQWATGLAAHFLNRPGRAR